MNEKPKLKNILQPCQIGQMNLKNRVVMPPMSTCYASEGGFVTERLKDYYEERARGGIGLLIVESACIDTATERVVGRQLAADDDRFVPGLQQLAQVIRKHGAKVALSLSHAGRASRSSVTHRQPIAPSAIAVKGAEPPRELTVGEIEDIITHFAQAAQRAQTAGFDGVEIHAAHRYLLSSFLSPAWNKRQDDFGGSLQNRARILLEIISRTKELLGRDYPVWCRINGMEYGLEGGTTLDEAREVAQMAERAGSDAVHVSAYGYGAYASVNRGCTGYPPGNLIHLAEGIKKVVSVPVIAVGRIDLQLGERFVEEQKADLVAIGRPLIADPFLSTKTIEGRHDDVTPCIACNVCIDELATMDMSVRCSVNASVGKEREYTVTPAQKCKRVLVVGGGPAGMEAARVAALRGHEVILYEKQRQLGGQLILAVKPPHKDEIQPLIDYLVAQISKLGIKVEVGKEADAATVDIIKPDVVILATGASSLIPRIPGVDRDNVIMAEDALSGKALGGSVAVIGGGLVGCETAEFLAERGKTVTIIEMLAEIAPRVGLSVRAGLLDRLTKKGVSMLTGMTCREITDAGVIVTSDGGQSQTIIEVDTVVVAAGAKPNTGLLDALEGKVSEIHLAGDCVAPNRILEAIADGSRVGRAV
jgi:2,4-dienoyl-CoA reductase-like NADH-dependent reductase (Old Yellow Enzyme family)/thioredoxin reductase